MRNLLVVFSVFAILVVLGLIWKFGRQFSLISFSLALILGGALGNLYDRLRFSTSSTSSRSISFDYHWPDFNVADSAICIGACSCSSKCCAPSTAQKGKE